MTKEELARHDGLNGNKAYVALHDAIYDCTDSDVWDFSDYRPGCDLTKKLKKDPRIRSLIEKSPVVGMLEGDGEKSSSDSPKGRLVLFLLFLMIAVVGAFKLIR